MPYDGNGAFLPLPSPTFPAVAGTVIYADYFNAIINDILANGLSNALTRDGQAAMTAALNMGLNKITNMLAGALPGDAVQFQQWQDSFAMPHFNAPTVDDMPVTPLPDGERVTNVNWIVAYVALILTPILADIALKSYRAGDTYTGNHNFAGAGTITLPATTSIGSVSATEISYIDGLASNAQTQLTTLANAVVARGLIAGQVWSGTHDFTAGELRAPTMPLTDSSTRVATMAALASAIFAGALPGQAGNDGKFVYTDGTNASWRFPYLKGVPVAGTSQLGVSGKLYLLRNAAVSTLTLPAAPADEDVIGLAADNLRIDNIVARNGQLIAGAAEDLIVDNPYYPLWLQFRTGYGWRLV